MSAPMTRLRGGRSVTWTTVLGIVLVPLTVAGFLIWGLWQPNERLDTVSAAVVNLDEPVELDGQLVPMGRVLAAELIGDDAASNYDWTLTNEEDAAEGLAEGRYATVVTIPSDFSQNATSLGGDAADVAAASITVEQTPQGKLIDGALAATVTSTAAALLNQQLGAQYIEGLLGGSRNSEMASMKPPMARARSPMVEGNSPMVRISSLMVRSNSLAA